MKTIKTPSGVKRIEDSDATLSLFKLREILTDERKLIINRLESNLTSYLDFRFHTKPNSKQIDGIKNQLASLKASNLDLEKYNAVVQCFLSNENTHVNAAQFYQEIDVCIEDELNSAQLRLV
ncbi:hypothetical protein [Pseudochryseolinea flava]|uniref:Uncharacterized protein n=1 Tax=Pseudochryseolinea flava TaxID=2059302 RepID=A0A364XY66_9BACT|nr:hypothetical protein [Pseudochryseolinea flava]RAV98510.1 hypothetical protein DQQ10_23605 [Pseudochryseolinea flava]